MKKVQRRQILMLNCVFILDLQKGLLPSTADQVELQTVASEQNKDVESGTDLKGEVRRNFNV